MQIKKKLFKQSYVIYLGYIYDPSTYAESMFIEGDNVVIEINCRNKNI